MARRKPQRQRQPPRAQPPPPRRWSWRGENRPLFLLAATALAVLWWAEIVAYGASFVRVVLAVVTTLIALAALLRLFWPALLPALARRRRRRLP